MTITKQIVVEKIAWYLRHCISLADDIGTTDNSRVALFILPSVRRLFATGRQNLSLSDSSLLVRAARETLLILST